MGPVTCKRGSGGAVLGKGQCRDTLERGGKGRIKERGGAEKYCRKEGGGISGRGGACLYRRVEVGGVREGAVQSSTAEGAG